MISTKFDKVTKLAEEIRFVDEEKVHSLITLCNQVKVNHQISTLKKIYDLFCSISLSFPHEDYILQIEITNNICDAFIEIGKLESKFILRKFDGVFLSHDIFFDRRFAKFSDPHIFAMGMYALLASKLNHLGITGELDNALLKTRDPWVNIYNRDTKKGDKFLKNELLFRKINIMYAKTNEANRQNFVGKYYLLFKNAITIGDINNEASYYFSSIKTYVNLGEKASISDILFYTYYLELLLSKNDIGTTFREIEQLLLNEFSIQSSLKQYTYSYEIAKTLAKVYKDRTWSEIALAIPTEEKHPSDVCSLEMLLIMKNNHSDSSQEIIAKIESLLFDARNSYPTRIMLDLYKKKYSFVFLETITYFYEKKDWISIIKVTYLWNCFNDIDDAVTNFKDKCILVSILNLTTEKPLYIFSDHGEVTYFEAESKWVLADIFKAKDLLEDSWTALIEAPESLEVKLADRMYIHTAKDYTNKLGEFVEIEKLSKLLEDSINDYIEFIEVCWTNTPVVPLLDNLIENKIVTLRTNKKLSSLKSIRKVLIWANPDSTLYRAQFEVDALKVLLDDREISYEVYSETECNKDLFLKKYADDEFDVLWLITHGEFDHNNPPNSRIIISSDAYITTKELSEIKIQRLTKRYLILNACQSATSEIRYNSMGFTGIASGLTNSQQSVLGHLWPVDAMGSVLFGCLIMKYLVSTDLPDLAFALKSTSKIMSFGNEAIISDLKSINSSLEIIDRIQSSSEDFSSPFYSQSAMVFE
ncbi:MULTISPECIES: CHAT domain-containing protein [unclassified Sporosarcina]|uniref:CHAT domain-containing protein n=1 Tax=unclassified Sporosarcina TaxID=2647733 RepID=UPI000C173736|nr:MULTISPECIES: CHAT domain-containing protein [unclassified Sporosarcina]PID04576.1 hypothetical protein CSV66_14365 [Sporosarcina sp. P30]PID07719.1 hypothetical protein CSV65_14630 [Sporosarcina sp. P31]PID10917.1 hypothetical protein CSV64_14600 [Sporosarcina sp. P32b]